MMDDDYRIVKRVKLTERHRPTGRARHYLGPSEMPTPAALAIATYDGEAFYLFYLDEEGTTMTDTLHDSLEAAQAQAEFEFGVEPNGWEDA